MLALVFGSILIFILIALGGWGSRDFGTSGKIFLGFIAGILFIVGVFGVVSIAVELGRNSKDTQTTINQEAPQKNENIPSEGDEGGSYGWIFWVLIFGVGLWNMYRPRKIETSLSVFQIDDKEIVGIEISNKESGKAHSFAIIINAIRDGVDIRREITPHTNRLQWYGGSDREFGIKILDSKIGFGIILVAQEENKTLKFFTDRDPLPLIDKFGYYELDIELRGQGGYEPKVPILINVNFNFDEKGLRLVKRE